MGAKGAKLIRTLGSCFPLRSRYQVKSVPQLTTPSNKPPCRSPYQLGYQTILAAVQLTVPYEEVSSGLEKFVYYDPVWIDTTNLDAPEYSSYLYGK